MAKQIIEERRRYLRLNVPVEIEYALPSSDRRCSTTTKDISAFGIKFLSQDKLQVNALLEITLRLPNTQNPVHVTGRVAWLKRAGSEDNSPCDIGIEFVKIEEDNKNTFLKYLCDVIYG